ncbi:CAAD domain-containing protein [Cyanobium sp. ATX 6A2]|uniref:CAAD domain-containing protein n=1 Tax=Cyanobium sp. ATX 6A2 TaxID=2823700 RepID=UPI0020CC3820|nr:CAAD domain-containing protein [Cyanobium sp. ATX 6A2]MCP9886531.1 CAAD domain-containing protein [Cyanobium sp. ATX 6A2]
MADTQRDDLQAASSPADTSTADTRAAAARAAEASAEAVTAADMSGESSHAPASEPTPPPLNEPTAVAEPTVETSTTVPALGGGATPTGDGDGGEWNLLVEKLQQWWRSGELQSLWQQAKTPLTLGLALITVLMVLRVYAGLLSAINSLPLVPGLLELVGVIWGVRYGLPKLIRRSERERLLDGLQQRWRSFRGQD